MVKFGSFLKDEPWERTTRKYTTDKKVTLQGTYEEITL
jgi:hypothetical protein